MIMDPGVYFLENIVNDSSSSEDEEDMLEDLVTGIPTNICQAAGTIAGAAPQKTKKDRSNFFMDSLGSITDEEFQEDFRLTTEAFDWVFDKLKPKLENFSSGPDTVSPKKQLLAVMWLLATPDSYRSVAHRLDMAKSTLHKCFGRVVKALCDLSKEVINWPCQAERNIIKPSFQRLANIPGVVAVIDGTYIPIKAPRDNPEIYINRKCFYGITLQAVCDNKRRFRDVFVGYPSSVGDLRIFRNSDIYKKINADPNLFFEDTEIMLGDKAYPILKWCIPPFIDRGNLDRMHLNFNTQHARTRQVIERTFALLFGRFRRLKYLDMSKAELIPDVVLACCILHNICLMFPNNLVERYAAEGQEFLDQLQHLEDDHFIPQDLAVSQQQGTQLRDQIANNLVLR